MARVDRVSFVLYAAYFYGRHLCTGAPAKAWRCGPTRNVRFLVDTGAIYSVLPEEIWRALRLKAERQVEFTLADGTPIERSVSECRFEIRGEAATSPVVLGEKNDGALLGAVTLETLGLMLNPLTREILPMRMALAHLRNSQWDKAA